MHLVDKTGGNALGSKGNFLTIRLVKEVSHRKQCNLFAEFLEEQIKQMPVRDALGINDSALE